MEKLKTPTLQQTKRKIFNPFRLDDIIPSEVPISQAKSLLRLAEMVTGLDYMAREYAKLPPSETPDIFAKRVLDHLNIKHDIAKGDLSSIPKSGSTLIVANHPFGGIEGILLLSLLLKVRPDVKIMANGLLQRIPEVASSFIGVNPYGGDKATKQNVRSMRTSYNWLKQGGLLLVFPAGDVSSLQIRKLRIGEKKWEKTIARLARMTKAPVVPLFISGRNSMLFNLLGKIHPRVRTILLPREMLNKKDWMVKLHIGKTIAPKRLIQCGNDEAIVNYLKLRCEMLGSKEQPYSFEWVKKIPGSQRIWPVKVVDPVEDSLLEHELGSLPKTQKMAEASGYESWCAYANQIPHIMKEIGRLREISFRENGQGTGKAFDIDKFDKYYLHLFVWDQKAKKIVGAYRLGQSDRINEMRGVKGFFTHRMFNFGSNFFEPINPGLELSRSFIRKEYQKAYAPLLMLWKGIGGYISKNPRYSTLFGAVSISNDYSSMAQQLIVDFIRMNSMDQGRAKLVRPQQPYKNRMLTAWDKSELADIRSLDLVSELVATLEDGRKGMPVLMRHYLNMGGRILTFNVDSSFGNCVDGLVFVDLLKTDRNVLNRYMGEKNAAAFLEHNGVDPLGDKLNLVEEADVRKEDTDKEKAA